MSKNGFNTVMKFPLAKKVKKKIIKKGDKKAVGTAKSSATAKQQQQQQLAVKPNMTRIESLLDTGEDEQASFRF